MKKLFTSTPRAPRKYPLEFLMLALILNSVSLMAQDAPTRVLTGKVKDAEGLELPGVTVVVKGTSIGTITDAGGAFSLKLNQPDPILVFSFVGYTSQEVVVGNQSDINISMASDTRQLSEIVITALGIEKEAAGLGYTAQKVQGNELVKAREPNAINSLVGKVAGLTVGPSSELLGRPQMVLRGRTDLLIVVDGVPVNSDTWNISADDVESYTVLKGANAAAIYGFRGQNGAIMITTKRGTKDKRGFAVDFNSSTMFDKSFLTVPPTQSEYGAGANYAYAFGNKPYDEDGGFRRANIWGPRYEGQDVRQYDSPVDPATGLRTGTPWTARGKDNYKNFMETGVLSTNHIAIAASNENSDLRISLSHSYQKGIAPNTRLQISNFNISAGHNFSSRLRLEGNLNFNRQYTPNVPDVNYGPNSYTYIFKVYGATHWDLNQMKDYYQSPGKPGVQEFWWEYGRNNNPYFMSYEWLRGHYKTDIYGYTKLSYKFTDYLNLSFRTQVSTWNSLRNEKLPYSAIIYGRDFRQGDYREDKRSLFENNSDLLLNFDKNIGTDLHVAALLGGNLRTFQYNSSWESTDYLIVPGVYNFSNSKNPKLLYNYKSDMQVLSSYYSLDLTYKHFVTLSSTGRDDKLSTLPKGKKSYFYPSVSLSTVVSDYLRLPGFISFLKLRGSYANVKGGLTSSQIGPAWAALGQPNPLQYGTDYYTSYDGPSYTNQNYYKIQNLYNNTPSADYSAALSNPNLKPFSTTSYETGVDLKFLENRLGLDVTYFTSIDGPRIFSQKLPSSTGYSSKIVNDLITKRAGWEIALTGSPLHNPDGLNWNVMANWSTYKETIKEIYDPSGILNGYFGDHNYKVGDRVDGVYDYKLLRDPNTGEYINQNGIPVIYQGGTNAKKLLGYSNPDFVWALNNRFSYKDFSFSFQFDGRVGGIIYNEIWGDQLQGGTSMDLVTGTMGEARRAEWESLKANGKITPSYVGPGLNIVGGTPKFDNEGNLTNYDELTLEPNGKAVRLISYAQFLQGKEPLYVSRTYAKLREVTIGYNLPPALLTRLGIRQASVTLVGRNLLYFAKRKDFDLDQFPAPGQVYPPLQTATLRRFGVNLNLTF